MTRSRILPQNVYFQELISISSNQGTNANEQSMEEELNEGKGDVEESEDKILGYECESDVEATYGEENGEEHVDCVTNVATFPFGYLVVEVIRGYALVINFRFE